MDDDLPFHYTNTSHGTYDVYLWDVFLGGVRHDPRAWSYGRWFADGEHVETSTGCYTIGPARGDRHHAPRKPHGYGKRSDVAYRLAIMQSGKLLAALPTRTS